MRAIGRLIASALRSRYGVALLIAGVVAAILSTTALLSPRGREPLAGPPVPAIATANPATGNDGLAHPPAPRLTTLPGGAAPGERAVAFAEAWLDASPGWSGRL